VILLKIANAVTLVEDSKNGPKVLSNTSSDCRAKKLNFVGLILPYRVKKLTTNKYLGELTLSDFADRMSQLNNQFPKSTKATTNKNSW